MLIRIRSDERGVAMITALMVTFIIAALALAVVQLSIHNVDASNYDRKRVQSVNASEAGIDYTWNLIEQSSPDTLATAYDTTTHQATYTGTLGTGPGTAHFTSVVRYYDASSALMTTAPTQSSYPSYALITSSGTTNAGVARTVQSYVKLSPIRQGIQSAVLMNSSASFVNNFTINGDVGNDGDIALDRFVARESHPASARSVALRASFPARFFCRGRQNGPPALVLQMPQPERNRIGSCRIGHFVHEGFQCENIAESAERP